MEWKILWIGWWLNIERISAIWNNNLLISPPRPTQEAPPFPPPTEMIFDFVHKCGFDVKRSQGIMFTDK